MLGLQIASLLFDPLLGLQSFPPNDEISRSLVSFERAERAFTAVTQRLNIYTAADFGRIIAHLNAHRGIGSLSVFGTAAKAQDYICRQPDRYEVLAAELGERALELPTAAFSWLKGRAV